MTIGIYKLLFANTTKCYIGQSVNIETRFKQHICSMINNTANHKLLFAYKEYGLPELHIVLECPSSELDDLEEEAIDIYDSVNNGFNIYEYANQTPTRTGFEYGNSKYTKEQILEVFKLLVQTSPLLGYDDIKKVTDVSNATICKIALKSQHTWLNEEYPAEYLLLDTLAPKRLKLSQSLNRVSAEYIGKVYPNIYSPDGSIYSVTNARQFAKVHNLAPNHLTEVLNGHRKSHKGWHL